MPLPCLEKTLSTLERHAWLALAGIMLLSFALKLTNISYSSLWIDEIYSFMVANGHLPPEDLTPKILTARHYYEHYVAWQPLEYGRLLELLKINVHLPLYYLLLNPWLKIFGNTEAGLRSFSALFTCLMLVPVYLTGRALSGRRAGLLSAFVAAVVPYQLYFGQEGRMYGLALFLAATASLCLWQLIYAERPKPWAFAYAASVVAGFFSHYIFLFFLSFHGAFTLVAFWRKPEKRYGYFLIPALAVLGALTYWFPIYQQQHQGVQEDYHFAKTMVSPIRYFNTFFWEPLVVVAGENKFLRIFYFPFTALAFAWTFLQARRNGFSWRREGFLLCWLIVPIAVQVAYDIANQTHTAVITRYTLLIAPAVYLWIGLGLAKIDPSSTWGKRLLPGLLAAMLLTAVANVWAPSPFRDISNKKDLKGQIQVLSEHLQPGDLVFVNGPFAVPNLLAFYLHRTRPEQPILYWVQAERSKTFALPNPALLAPYKRVWFLRERSNRRRGLQASKDFLAELYPTLTEGPNGWRLYSRP